MGLSWTCPNCEWVQGTDQPRAPIRSPADPPKCQLLTSHSQSGLSYLAQYTYLNPKMKDQHLYINNLGQIATEGLQGCIKQKDKNLGGVSGFCPPYYSQEICRPVFKDRGHPGSF